MTTKLTSERIFQQSLRLSAWLIFTLAMSCVQRFDVVIPRNADNYIVEAILLDDPRYQKVRLLTINAKGLVEPVETARVVVETEANRELEMEHLDSGEYVLGEFLQVATGDSLRLVIYLTGESRIVSEWEEVPESTGIAEGYWEPAVEKNVNDLGVIIEKPGFDLKISTTPFVAEDTYLRYTYETSHVNEAPFRDSRCECLNCYITTSPIGFLKISSALRSKGKSLQNELVDFLDLDRRFSFRLTALVRQITITPSAHQFYAAIDQQRTLEGSIFDPPPAIIRGNLSFEGSQDVEAYGIFEVGRLAEVPITIFRSQFENQFLTYMDICFAAARGGGNEIPDECFFCFAEEGSGPRPYYYEE